MGQKEAAKGVTPTLDRVSTPPSGWGLFVNDIAGRAAYKVLTVLIPKPRLARDRTVAKLDAKLERRIEWFG